MEFGLRLNRDVNLLKNMDKIQLSVVIVNYNGKKYADACIESILSSNVKDFQIIVVDNDSTDGSVEYLKTKYNKYQDRFKIVTLDKNYGPAKARNEGVKASQGKYICFLDNDTIVHPEWANEAIKAFKENSKIGIIQCKLLLAKERRKIDYVGEYLGQNGFLVQKASAGERDTGQYNKRIKILAAKSAGMFIRKKTFETIAGFDEDYFIYVEETDLGWRSWLAGYINVLIPTSIVYHEFGTSSLILGKEDNNRNTKYHGAKNYILTLFKNLSLANLLNILPKHIILWFGMAWYSLLLGNYKVFLWIHKGILWNLINLDKNLIKRHAIQSQRKISDRELFKIIIRKKPFLYYFKKATSKEIIGNAEGFTKTEESINAIK